MAADPVSAALYRRRPVWACMCVCVGSHIHSCVRVCVCMCVAMLPSLVLHRTSVRPYQRGLYCGDSSLNYPYKKSTVPSSVLTSVGLTLPVVSVSRPRPPQHTWSTGGQTEGRHRQSFWFMMVTKNNRISNIKQKFGPYMTISSSTHFCQIP